MAEINPFDKYLPEQTATGEQGESKVKLNPFDIFVPGNLRESKFNYTQEPGIHQAIDETKERDNPFDKYLPNQKLGSSSLWDDVSFAFKLGFLDTARGVSQFLGKDKMFFDNDFLKVDQQELYSKMQGPNGAWVTAAYFGGSILDPAGWLIPVTKGKTLYQLAKYGFVSGGIAGALGYVDEESMLDTRGKQAAAGALGGTIVSPILGGTINLLRGKKTPLGIPGTDMGDKTIKDLRASQLHKTELLNEAGEANRIAQIRKGKFAIEEDVLIKDIPTDRQLDKAGLMYPIRAFFKENVIDTYREKVGGPLFSKLTKGRFDNAKDAYQGYVGRPLYEKIATSGEMGTGAAGGLLGFASAEEDAPITERLGRAAVGFGAGYAGIKFGAKKFKRKFTGYAGEEIEETWADFLGRNFIDRYKLPKEFAKAKADSQGFSNHIAHRFLTIAKKVKDNLTADESKVLYNMLQGDNIYDVPSSTLKSLRKEARDLITEIGQEYVDSGLITKETFARNKNIYLKRSYLKNVDDRAYGEELRNRGLVLKVTKQEYNRIYKKQKAYLTTGLEQDPDTGLFKVVDKNKRTLIKDHRGWELLGTSEKQFSKLKDGDEIQIRWEYTKPQRVGLGEIEDAAFGIAETGRALSTTLPKFKFYDNLSKIDSIAYTKPSFAERQKFKLIKMPTNNIQGTEKKVFGNLAGKYVPEEVYKNLVSAERYSTIPKNQLFKAYKKVNSLWKVSKTAWNPTVHVNNVLSNFLLTDAVDGSYKYLRPAFKALTTHGKNKQRSELVELAQKHGLFDADFVNVELKSIQADKLDFPYKIDPKGNPFSDASEAALSVYKDLKKTNLVNKATEWYRMEDSIFRLALFMDRLKKGFTPAEAALDGRRSFIDYNIDAPAINALRNSATPFLAYTYRIVPLLAETAIVRPWKFIKYAALGHALNEMGNIMGGGDEEAERAVMPERKQGKIFGNFPYMPYRNIKLPEVRLSDEKPFIGPKYIDITRYVPGGDILDLGTGGIPGLPAPLQPSFGLAGDVLFPLLGYDSFRLRNVPGLTGIPSEDALVKLNAIKDKLTPNIPFFPGSYSTQRIQKARSEMESPFAVKQTEAEAFLNTIGFKIERADLMKMTANKQMEMERKLRGFQEQISQQGKKYSSGLINSETLNKKIDNITKKMEKLMDKYNIKFSKTSGEFKKPFTVDIDILTNPFIK